MAGLVTLLTDFGTRDGYVAAMKGALLRRAPDLRLVDVSHEIPPGDVAAAAYVLLQAAPHFPDEAVHLVVIDPGVGSERLALAGRLGPAFYVAPDNGVLGYVLDSAAPALFHEIRHPAFALPGASAVFHGRDVFAPAAALLACGGALEQLGPALEPGRLVRLPGEPPRRDGEGWRGAIIHVDAFGNLVSNIPVSPDPVPEAKLEIAGRELPLVRTYRDAAPGDLVALRGSSGLLEVAVTDGSAALLTGSVRGDVVVLRVPPRS